MSDNLFNSQTTENNTTPPVNNNDALNDLLASIKNEQGQPKYRSIEDALKGLQHAQSYIAEVKQERNTIAAKLEEEAAKAREVEELKRVVAEITQKQDKKDVQPTPSIGADDITNLVKSQLAIERQQEQQSLNKNTVRKALVEKFGEEKAAEVFNQKADELGLSAEKLTQIVAESPKAALAMLGVSGDVAHKQTGFSPNSTKLRTEGVPQRRESLIGKLDAFRLPTGHTDSDVKALKQRSDQLLEELNENGITVDDLTIPSNYFKIFR